MWCGDCWASHLELYVPLLPQTAASYPIHAEGWVTNDTCSGADLQQQGKWEGPQSSVQKLQEDNSSLCFHSQKNSWGESHSYVCLWFLLKLVIYSALSAHLSYFLFFCCFPGVSLLLLLHWRLWSTHLLWSTNEPAAHLCTFTARDWTPKLWWASFVNRKTVWEREKTALRSTRRMKCCSRW